ncbi:hypothetical protein [Streptomyces sp. BE303]|uniref:hypothetical protein n=1 Tax=Streptomyces sp. BE303 TaxID=3002528 RepID=UPI002E786114|nr:hypothetical protein [Streptomyces sp. BE303]MED7948032.1 hypothetical protein [Streptomyces sp. BE303]
MAVTTSARRTRTYDEYRAEQRKQVPAGDPLDDYETKVSARVSGRGIPRDWPFCTCGADICPDKGLT